MACTYRSVPHIRPPSLISPPTFSAKVLAQQGRQSRSGKLCSWSLECRHYCRRHVPRDVKCHCFQDIDVWFRVVGHMYESHCFFRGKGVRRVANILSIWNILVFAQNMLFSFVVFLPQTIITHSTQAVYCFPGIILSLQALLHIISL